MKNQAEWFLRIPFAAVFLYHGAGKLFMPAMSAEMLGLSVAVVILVGIAEVAAGLGAILGGIPAVARRHLITCLAGVAAVPVMLGAIILVHWPRWSFAPTEAHPMGGMEFQVVLLGIALYFLLRGAANISRPVAA